MRARGDFTVAYINTHNTILLLHGIDLHLAGTGRYLATYIGTSLNEYCLVMVRIQIWYRNKQYNERQLCTSKYTL